MEVGSLKVLALQEGNKVHPWWQGRAKDIKVTTHSSWYTFLSQTDQARATLRLKHGQALSVELLKQTLVTASFLQRNGQTQMSIITIGRQNTKEQNEV